MVKEIVETLECAQMLCTRMCHDLAGPIGAVNNGLEFLRGDDSADMMEQAHSLLGLSAGEAFAKLRMYRIAYGAVRANMESPIDEVKEVVVDYFKHGKIKVDWPNSPEDGFPVKMMSVHRQMLVCMVLVASATLIYGGKLSVRKHTDGDTRTMEIIGHGERLKQDQDILDILQNKDKTPALSSYNVTYYYLRYLLDEHRMRSSLKIEGNDIIYRVSY